MAVVSSNGTGNGRVVLPRSGLVLPAGVRSVTPKPRETARFSTRDPNRPRRGQAVSEREVTSELGGEIGTSGLKQYGGFVLEEWLPKLRGKYGAWAYREMMDNSPTAGGIIFAIKSLARQVEFSVEDDVPISGQDMGFCESCMHDMSHTWLDFISEALSMCGYGWAAHEEVYKYRRGGDPIPSILGAMDDNPTEGDVRSEDVDPTPPSSQYNDGRIGWRKLPIRAQETLMRWWFRGYAGLRAMEQIDWHGGRHVIPIGKMMLFRTETTRQNPEGRSLLRNAWTSFYAIQNIQAIEAIGIERDLAGIPRISPPPNVDLTSNENSHLLEIAKEIVRDIRRDEDEGIVLPSGEWDFDLVSTGGSRQIDTDEVIRRYENRMLTSVLADFLAVGQDGMGSYAMVDVKAELFGVALDAILDLVCEVVSRYGFPRLLALNDMHPKKMPKLRHSSAGRIDLRLVGEFLTNISLAGAQVPWSKGLIEHLFRAGALPEPEWDDLMAPPQPSPVAHDSQWRPAWGSEDGPTQQPPKPQAEEKTPGRAASEPKPPAKPTERDHVAKADNLVDLSGPLAERHAALSTQMERDMEGTLGELGARAARAYASLDQTRRRNADQAAGAVVSRAGVHAFVNERLQPVLHVHAGRVAQDTQRVVRGALGVDARIDEQSLGRMRQAAGRHLRTRDLEPQVRDAVKGAIEEGTAAGESPTQVGARIRENVPRGRFRLAGARWRAGLIARTETSNLQRMASIEAYHAAGNVPSVQAIGNGGTGAPRDGEIIPIDEARDAAASQHPDSRQSFSPVLA